ncbi:MAG: acetyl-CoA carboxylase biotin carboxylase subunit, partial [Calditrichaeota bacterium]|nr:acetyl-CoA carboxylase biotin carboxylase subunit [Calditrichota bacterium]
ENFMPSIGTSSYLKSPDGPGIREDSGVELGSEVSFYYDPMLSKLCAWGSNRDEAIFRMKRGLKEYQISGVQTTIPFCLLVLDHKDFRNGSYSTDFVGKQLNRLLESEFNTEPIAALAAALIVHHQRENSEVIVRQSKKSNWKLNSLKLR